MKLLFISNYFNHHQKFLSDAFEAMCDDYKFVSTAKMRDERRKLGYDNSLLPDYVIDLSEREPCGAIAQILSGYDAVIVGSAPEGCFAAEEKEKKLTFRYSERLYKQKYQWYKWPFRLITFYKKFGRYKNTYLLCAGAFTYADFAKHGSFINKAYKWGYFPETKRYKSIERLVEKKKKNSILWCGRFIDWKHPDDALCVAERLKAAGYSFALNIIGAGELEPKLKSMIEQYGLNDCVHMLGAMPPENVREYMEISQIYIFTSDRSEGWGAVLNESMNSGCAVVASDAIGAVPYLIRDKQNGLIYESGNTEMLFEAVKALLDDPAYAGAIGKKAYETIVTEWNAEIAAERLVNLAGHILAGEKHPELYKTGPCSKAEIIKDGWYRSK